MCMLCDDEKAYQAYMNYLDKMERQGKAADPDVAVNAVLDEGEHGVELALQMRNLVLGNRNARQMRDAADGSGVDGHYIRPLTAKPNRRIAEAAFAPQPAPEA